MTFLALLFSTCSAIETPIPANAPTIPPIAEPIAAPGIAPIPPTGDPAAKPIPVPSADPAPTPATIFVSQFAEPEAFLIFFSISASFLTFSASSSVARPVARDANSSTLMFSMLWRSSALNCSNNC